jgi:hypothetical protein
MLTRADANMLRLLARRDSAARLFGSPAGSGRSACTHRIIRFRIGVVPSRLRSDFCATGYSPSISGPQRWLSARGRFLAIAVLGTAASALLLKDVEASSLDSQDPIETLDPQRLSVSTAHLRDVPTVDLLRGWVVYLLCSSSLFVDTSPRILEFAEWTGDALPLGLGKPIVWVVRWVTTAIPVYFEIYTRSSRKIFNVGHEAYFRRAGDCQRDL